MDDELRHMQLYREHIEKLATRTNTITGVAYRDEPDLATVLPEVVTNAVFGYAGATRRAASWNSNRIRGR